MSLVALACTISPDLARSSGTWTVHLPAPGPGIIEAMIEYRLRKFIRIGFDNNKKKKYNKSFEIILIRLDSA
jgi:hypothetical protein